jgi:MYXO-CTERM domain-containing protein
MAERRKSNKTAAAPLVAPQTSIEEIRELRFMKAKIRLILVCAAISIAPCIVSAQTPSPAPTETTTAESKPPRDHRSNYGLLGLLGLLGLAGLVRRKSGARKIDPMDERPPAPSGSYVSDLKTERRAKPE